MSLKIIYFKLILLTFILIISFQFEVYSQETDISTENQSGMFVGISFGPSQSHIMNVGTMSVSDLLSLKKTSFFGSVEIGYFFSKNIGLSTGIGFISYKTQLTLDTYQNIFNTTDSENESYERRVTGSGIKEEQNIDFLSVPICINLRLPFNETTGFFLQTDVNMGVPIIRDYISSGTFTYKGYYPAHNVLLEDLPSYGFPSNKSIVTYGELELKPFNFSVNASAGFDLFIQKKFQIAIAACFDKSLSKISNYFSPDIFQLSSDPEQINSLMGGSSKVTAQSMGLKIIFRYYLK